MVSRNSPTPLFRQIEQRLRDDINSGRLPPLAKVPSEAELVRRFDVSRMTARRAVEALAAAGLVFRRAGIGTFVAAEKIAHELSTRVSFSKAMDDLGLPHRTKVLEAGTIRAQPHVARALQLPGNAQVVHLRRVRLVEDIPVAVHEAFLPQTYASIHEYDLRGSLNEIMGRVGAAVDVASDWVEATAADEEAASILGVKRGEPLVRIEGIGRSAAAVPLRFSSGLYRADRFRFRVESSAQLDVQAEWIENRNARAPLGSQETLMEMLW